MNVIVKYGEIDQNIYGCVVVTPDHFVVKKTEYTPDRGEAKRIARRLYNHYRVHGVAARVEMVD